MKRLRLFFASCAVLVLSVGVTSALAGGNSANAKLCQKGGWENVYRIGGGAFANQDDCVSYAAQGGTLYGSQAQAICQSYGGTYSTNPVTDLALGGDGSFIWSCNGFSPFSLSGAQIFTMQGACFGDGGDDLASSENFVDFTCAKL